MSSGRGGGGMNRVVPVAVEPMPFEAHRGELRVGHGHAFGVQPAIQLRSNAESRPTPRRADETDDRRQVHQRGAPPVHRDVGEQPVLDLVPLARAGREVTDRDGEAGAIRQALQLPLPEPQACPVAPARIRGDQQRTDAAIGGSPHHAPPSPDRVDREAGRVMVDAHAYPPFVTLEIVDTVRNGLATPRGSRGDHKVMHAHALGRLHRPPRPPAILEVADQLFLLRVDGDRRLPTALPPAHRLRDIAKLRIPIGMLPSLTRLDVALEAVTQRVQEVGDHRVADVMPQALHGHRHTAVADGARFRRRPHPTRALRKHRRECGVFRAQRGHLHRAGPYHPWIASTSTYLLTAPKWFGCDDESPYMLYTYRSTTGALAAVTHVNGTA